jgi:hypothetical protein
VVITAGGTNNGDNSNGVTPDLRLTPAVVGSKPAAGKAKAAVKVVKKATAAKLKTGR